MRIAFFDTHKFEQEVFLSEKTEHELVFLEPRLTAATANLAKGFECVCLFVNDGANRDVLQILAAGGTRLIALRSAGFNHVDLVAAAELDIKVVRVPEYSPYAVAEHAVALMLTLNRKIHRAYNRVREMNFSLDGLVGFDLHQKTVGIVGTGRIGKVLAKILFGFGCKILAYDKVQDKELVSLGASYVELEALCRASDIISLHVPLQPTTQHLLNEGTLAMTKPGVMLINTGRGALIETKALIKYLKSGHIGYAGLDVYEEEEGIFFEDLSGQVLQDDTLARLLTFPNVLMTSHQAFLTNEALQNIAATTLENISAFARKQPLHNEVSAAQNVR